jgi:hypothetical protein
MRSCEGKMLTALQFLTVWWAEFEPHLLEAAVVQPLQVMVSSIE